MSTAARRGGDTQGEEVRCRRTCLRELPTLRRIGASAQAGLGHGRAVGRATGTAAGAASVDDASETGHLPLAVLLHRAFLATKEDGIDMLCVHLLPQVFYQEMKADHYRYVAGFSDGDAKSKMAE